MADKQRAYDTRNNANLFADDDPLAELARIVGFEPRVAANTVPDAPRHEPAFNLEDELLREFERYDAPTAPAVIDPPVEAAFIEPVANAAPEPVYEAEPVQYDAPVVPEQDIYYEAPVKPSSLTPPPCILPADWTSAFLGRPSLYRRCTRPDRGT
jgi:hypothetical protein